MSHVWRKQQERLVCAQEAVYCCLPPSSRIESLPSGTLDGWLFLCLQQQSALDVPASRKVCEKPNLQDSLLLISGRAIFIVVHGEACRWCLKASQVTNS